METLKKKNLTIILFYILFTIILVFAAVIAIQDNPTDAEKILFASDTIKAPLATTYSITYVLDGGTNHPINPTSVQSSDSTFYLQPASKDGYKFIGWYKDPEHTSYIEKVKPSTMSGNLTVYALFSQYISLPVKYSYTDYYNAYDDTKGYINCYYNYYSYYYENLDTVKSMVADHTEYTIYNQSNSALSLKQDDAGYFTTSSSGIPSYIRITSASFYSITYNTLGGTIPEDVHPYNYYYTKTEARNQDITPIRGDDFFAGWYLDAEYTSTMYSSEFTPSNITLYARWMEAHPITATYTYTDFFEIYTEVVETLNYYEEELDYYYTDNFFNLASYHAEYTYNIYDANGKVVPYFELNGIIGSHKSKGVPSYIKYNTPTIYSISYELGEGTYLKDGERLFNYYTKRVDLKQNTAEPQRDGYIFSGWYLDAEYSSTVYSSSFEASDITLYAKWEEPKYLDVYYYDANQEIPGYTLLGTSYYYLTETNEYYLGDIQDETKQLPYYFKQTGSTSYKAYALDNSEIHVYTNNGKLYANADKEISFVRIYLHYTISFYVNGSLVFETRGAKDEQIVLPTFITGYIGQNYNAIKIGSLTLGKEYAVYIMKGWSLIDSSDITWLDKEEVDLISDDITYDKLVEGEYIMQLYAYMTYYGKVNAINSDIDYDEYIKSTNGIITEASIYTLDDLMLEHVTEISSDAQKSNFEKILRYFKLDSLGNNTLGLLNKLLNGEKLSFNDLWGSLFGKILIIVLGLVTISLVCISVYNFAKAMSKIQSHS